MKKLTYLPVFIIASFVFVSCDDTNNSVSEQVYLDGDEAVVVNDADMSATALDDDLTYEAPVMTAPSAVNNSVSSASDRADQPLSATTASGLMPDEIRYRNSNGDVNWNALPDEQIDGLGSDWD